MPSTEPPSSTSPGSANHPDPMLQSRQATDEDGHQGPNGPVTEAASDGSSHLAPSSRVPALFDSKTISGTPPSSVPTSTVVDAKSTLSIATDPMSASSTAIDDGAVTRKRRRSLEEDVTTRGEEVPTTGSDPSSDEETDAYEDEEHPDGSDRPSNPDLTAALMRSTHIYTRITDDMVEYVNRVFGRRESATYFNPGDPVPVPGFKEGFYPSFY